MVCRASVSGGEGEGACTALLGGGRESCGPIAIRKDTEDQVEVRNMPVNSKLYLSSHKNSTCRRE